MASAWFEITAKLPEGATQEQAPEMLRTLLAERFKLAVRWEATEQSAFVLGIAKSGQKLKEAASDAGANPEWRSKIGERHPVMRTTTANGWVIYSRLDGNIVLDANRISMEDLAIAFSREVGQPVLDRTGLKGLYEVSIPVPGTWLTDAFPSRDAPGNPTAEISEPGSGSIKKSAEKLGLLLTKTRASISDLNVDHVEKRPAEN